MTPIQYQKHIRLREARMRLMSGDDDVTAVGSSVGYDSPSPFSREFRRLFGTAPGKDREYLRAQFDSPIDSEMIALPEERALKSDAHLCSPLSKNAIYFLKVVKSSDSVGWSAN